MSTTRSWIGWRATRAAAGLLDLASKVMGTTSPLGVIAQQNAAALRKCPRGSAESV